MIKYYTVYLVLSFLSPIVFCVSDFEETRDHKLISTFQVVRFPNDACVGSNSRNGTCYTSQECSSKGGASSGSCADGFGVCCTFVIKTCGQSSTENLTVWTQPTTVSAGMCSLSVCPTSDEICQLRLDFTTFSITGPSTLTLVQVRRQSGQVTQNLPDAYALQGSTYTGMCFTDIFYAQGATPSSSPPGICGLNTGQHMYVEADVDRCNKLQFSLADMATDGTTQLTTNRGQTALGTRTWDITISQIECTSSTLPPIGCTKYWWGSGRATLTNYNFKSGMGTLDITGYHLGMQHERMCIRRERGNCLGCFAAADNNFSLSAAEDAAAEQYTVATGCCGMASFAPIAIPTIAAQIALQGVNDVANDKSQYGFDCIIIPGAFLPTAAIIGVVITAQTAAIIQQVFTESPTAEVHPTPSGPHICGNGLGIGGGAINLDSMPWDDGEGTASSNGAGTNQTVCTRNTPFLLEFMSDDLEGLGVNSEDSEFADAGGKWGQGFSIDHRQLACS